MKKKYYNRVLRRPSPPLHLAGGVLLGKAYRGCNGEARWVEEFESYLPMPVFGSVVAGIEVTGIEGGGGARVAGGVEEEELRVVERRMHEHRESMRKLLGWLSCSVFAGIGRSTVSLELAGSGAIGRRRLSEFLWDSARVCASRGSCEAAGVVRGANAGWWRWLHGEFLLA